MKRWMLVPMFAFWVVALAWAWVIISPWYVGFNVGVFVLFFLMGRLSR